MSVLALGVSYRRAPVELLERLAFMEADDPKAYRRLLEMESVREAVILSTCNRVEVFAEVTSYHAGFVDLKRFLSESREVAPEDIAEPLYSHYEDDVAEHLFSVASGIDSMVLGEPQILAQVRDAFRRAEAEGAAGAHLRALFRAAVRTGRRARAETRIGVSPAAFVEAGATLADRYLGGLEGRSVVVVGAGSMAALAVKHLTGRGAARIRIVNRTITRAASLAGMTGGEALGLDALATALREADVVVSSTGSAGTVIGHQVVREAVANGRLGGLGRPLFILDLAVPRDVDPLVATLPGVRLADIDDLREILERAEDRGALGEAEKVRGIITEEVRRYGERRRAARLSPLIQALRDRGAQIQAAELARLAPRLSSLSPRQWEAVEAMAGGIVAKLLHQPIVKIKEGTGQGQDALARAAAELFGVDFRPQP
jgi:glutamyl-tRNA reductase